MEFQYPDDVQVEDGCLYAVVDASGHIYECWSEVAGSDVSFVSSGTGEAVTPAGLCLIA